MTVGGGITQESDEPATLPERIDVTQLFPASRIDYQRLLVPPDAPVAPVIVGPAFLERTGAEVGDTLKASAFGVPFDIRIIGEVDGFPTVDSAKPFALVDGLALDLVRLEAGVAPAATTEWWLSTPDGRAPRSPRRSRPTRSPPPTSSIGRRSRRSSPATRSASASSASSGSGRSRPSCSRRSGSS